MFTAVHCCKIKLWFLINNQCIILSNSLTLFLFSHTKRTFYNLTSVVDICVAVLTVLVLEGFLYLFIYNIHL